MEEQIYKLLSSYQSPIESKNAINGSVPQLKLFNPESSSKIAASIADIQTLTTKKTVVHPDLRSNFHQFLHSICATEHTGHVSSDVKLNVYLRNIEKRLKKYDKIEPDDLQMRQNVEKFRKMNKDSTVSIRNQLDKNNSKTYKRLETQILRAKFEMTYPKESNPLFEDSDNLTDCLNATTRKLERTIIDSEAFSKPELTVMEITMNEQENQTELLTRKKCEKLLDLAQSLINFRYYLRKGDLVSVKLIECVFNKVYVKYHALTATSEFLTSFDEKFLNYRRLDDDFRMKIWIAVPGIIEKYILTIIIEKILKIDFTHNVSLNSSKSKMFSYHNKKLVYDALKNLESFKQLCSFSIASKSILRISMSIIVQLYINLKFNYKVFAFFQNYIDIVIRSGQNVEFQTYEIERLFSLSLIDEGFVDIDDKEFVDDIINQIRMMEYNQAVALMIYFESLPKFLNNYFEKTCENWGVVKVDEEENKQIKQLISSARDPSEPKKMARELIDAPINIDEVQQSISSLMEPFEAKQTTNELVHASMDIEEVGQPISSSLKETIQSEININELNHIPMDIDEIKPPTNTLKNASKPRKSKKSASELSDAPIDLREIKQPIPLLKKTTRKSKKSADELSNAPINLNEMIKPIPPSKKTSRKSANELSSAPINLNEIIQPISSLTKTTRPRRPRKVDGETTDAPIIAKEIQVTNSSSKKTSKPKKPAKESIPAPKDTGGIEQNSSKKITKLKNPKKPIDDNSKDVKEKKKPNQPSKKSSEPRKPKKIAEVQTDAQMVTEENRQAISDSKNASKTKKPANRVIQVQTVIDKTKQPVSISTKASTSRNTRKATNELTHGPINGKEKEQIISSSKEPSKNKNITNGLTHAPMDLNLNTEVIIIDDVEEMIIDDPKSTVFNDHETIIIIDSD